DPKIVGETMRLDGRDYTVVGIVPASVRLDRARNTFFNDLFLPIGQNDSALFYDRGTGNNTRGLGRLKRGVTLRQLGLRWTRLCEISRPNTRMKIVELAQTSSHSSRTSPASCGRRLLLSASLSVLFC